LLWLNDSDPNDGISFWIPSIYIQEVLEGVVLVAVALLLVAVVAVVAVVVALVLLLLVFVLVLVLVLVLLLMLLAVELVTVSTCSLDDNDRDRDTNCNTDVIGVGILELLVDDEADAGNDDGSGSVFIPFFISKRAVSDCITTPSTFFLKAVNFLFNATRSSAIGGSA
jgi:hypothetical protein